MARASERTLKVKSKPQNRVVEMFGRLDDNVTLHSQVAAAILRLALVSFPVSNSLSVEMKFIQTDKNRDQREIKKTLLPLKGKMNLRGK